MHRWIILLLFAFSSILLSESPTQTEHCLRLKDVGAQRKCADAEYKTADKKLNETYQDVRKNLSESEKDELKKLQRLWIGHRDGICEGPMYYSDETGIDQVLCKTQTTIERTDYLKKVWMRKDFPKDGLGTYTDGFGGSLKLFEDKKEIRFSFEVVRGPTAHSGEVDGVWKPNREKKWTWASTPGCKEEDTDCCLLQFEVVNSNRIDVEEISCSYYHGARAYFGGSYRYGFPKANTSEQK